MAANTLNHFVRRLRRAALLADGGPTDGQLLGRFLATRDEAAFEALVCRHGPMVLGVCRRVLRNEHDAEDAFQATFLVLVRKAASVVPRDLVGNWLYGVAYRTALEAKTKAARRRVKEGQVRDMRRVEHLEENAWAELQPLLDQELSRLPDRYRVPVVLCDLEGKTHREAARLIGCPEGTVSGRLARARRLLAARLARRGVTLGAGLAVLSRPALAAPVPPALVLSTMKAAAWVAAGQAVVSGPVSAGVAALTQGVLKAMLLTKLQGVAWALLALGALAGGIVMLPHPSWAVSRPLDKRAADANQEGNGEAAAEAAAQQLPAGPMPEQALARLAADGKVSLRFRRLFYQPKTAKVRGQQVTYYEAVDRLEVSRHDPEALQVFDTKGKRLPTDALPRLLKKERVVLVSVGDKLEPLHLRVIKEGTLIVILPSAKVPPVAPAADLIVPGPAQAAPAIPRPPAPAPAALPPTPPLPEDAPGIRPPARAVPPPPATPPVEPAPAAPPPPPARLPPAPPAGAGPIPPPTLPATTPPIPTNDPVPS